MANTKEGIIQRSIMEALWRIPKGVVLRYNNTPAYDTKTKIFRSSHGRFQPFGVPDLFFFCNGKAFAIEVKTPEEYKYIMKNYFELKNGFYRRKGEDVTSSEKKKARLQTQIQFIERFNKTGNIGFFTSDVKECFDAVMEAIGL